ncbi:MAG: rRNA maturation RNase YbeY [Phycisphaerales bacterium]
MLYRPDSKQNLDSTAPAAGDVPLVTWLDRSAGLAASDLIWLQHHLTAALDRLGTRGEVRVASVGDAEMTAAHARTLGIHESTDVLTFDLAEPGPDSQNHAAALDTDIMVCVDEARRHAPEPDALRRELLLYALHGVLHCLGHDDHDQADFDRMHALEDQVLTAIGVGPVFAPSQAALPVQPSEEVRA